MKPNDLYRGRTATLTSKRCILYIYSTNICTEYFFSLQNAVCFIILMYLVPVLFAFYIRGVLKLKKNNSGAKSLRKFVEMFRCWLKSDKNNCHLTWTPMCIYDSTSQWMFVITETYRSVWETTWRSESRYISWSFTCLVKRSVGR